ncbi:MAG: RNA polymerase sigma factor [Muribaculaceae bacterium]|nr:RNA polymerase sigma factor [Muribaculaceae bacterium]
MTREQFIALVESSQRAFRRFLVALCCGDSQLADDIAQESYVKAYLSCHELSALEKFNAWLYRIGYNTFVSHKRAERCTVDYDSAGRMAADDASDSAFRYQELYMALDGLPANERSAILLFYMEGYAIKEISVITGASQDAVKQYLSRGRKHLRGMLSDN